MTQARDADLMLERERTPEGHLRVKLTRDGKEISGASIIPMVVQIGIARLRMDGIGGVATDADHRYKGYSRRVMEACVEVMKQGDALVTTLYGIPRFYPKYGYATLGPEPKIELEIDTVPEDFPEGYAARRMRTDDLAAVQALYDAGMEQSIGSLVRDPHVPSWTKLADSAKSDEDESRVVVNADGQVVAYAWRASWCWWMSASHNKRSDALQISEAFAASPPAADALLVACRQWAVDHAHETFELMVPPDGQVGTAAALRGALIRLLHTFEGEYMGRSLDVARLFQDLQPELQRRWASSPLTWHGRFVIDTGEDRVALTFGDGSLMVAPGAGTFDAPRVALSPGEIARLVFGGLAPGHVLNRAGIAEPEAAVLATLFPQGFPYIYPADRF